MKVFYMQSEDLCCRIQWIFRKLYFIPVIFFFFFNLGWLLACTFSCLVYLFIFWVNYVLLNCSLQSLIVYCEEYVLINCSRQSLIVYCEEYFYIVASLFSLFYFKGPLLFFFFLNAKINSFIPKLSCTIKPNCLIS